MKLEKGGIGVSKGLMGSIKINCMLTKMGGGKGEKKKKISFFFLFLFVKSKGLSS